MKTTLSRLWLIALAAVLAPVFALPAHADPASDLQALADSKGKLPLSYKIEKGQPTTDGGPYVVIFSNTSTQPITVTATVLWSVQSHNRAQTSELPPQTIAPGKRWPVNGLAVADKVTVKADGYEPLVVTIPAQK
jgi:hypothetical protein